ncbi:MAG: hypothetical protein N3A38_12000 [Planctomycetota bacterium]|nr:hypothetical protein [Planctomycetota bacterium]
MRKIGTNAWLVCAFLLAAVGCAGGRGRADGRAGAPEGRRAEVEKAAEAKPAEAPKAETRTETPKPEGKAEGSPAARTPLAEETKPSEKPAAGKQEENAGKPPASDDEAIELLKKKADDRPVMRVRTVEKGPEVDGKIDEIYGKSGAAIALRMNDGSRRSPSDKTSAWILADAENLYVAVRAETKNPDRIVATKRQRDDDVWQDETVEIFLDPENTRESRYFHIIANAAGTLQDSRDKDDSSWNPKIEVKCGKEPGKAWVAEMKIPFSELGVKPGKLNKIWGFNLTRTARDPEDPATVEDTAWSPTESRSPHVPEKFGYMFLERGEVLNLPK